MVELKRRIVLLVDDEENVRRTVRAFLESFGVYVLESDGAAQATRLAQTTPLQIDLLITDVLLPYVNGRDLANRVCALRPDIKVLFISGYPLEVLESHGLCPSRAELLLKPFTRRALSEKVAQVLENAPLWKSLAPTGDGTLAA